MCPLFSPYLDMWCQIQIARCLSIKRKYIERARKRVVEGRWRNARVQRVAFSTIQLEDRWRFQQNTLVRFFTFLLHLSFFFQRLRHFHFFKKTKKRKKPSEKERERRKKMSIVVYCPLFISNHHNDDKATSSTFDASLCSLHLIHRHLASALCLANRSCLRAVRGDHLDCVLSSHSTNAPRIFDRIEQQSQFHARTRPSPSLNPANRRGASNESATLSKGELLLSDVER